MTMPKQPWLKVAVDPWRTICERCGEEEAVPLPLEVSVVLKWFDYASAKHADCKEPTA